MLKDEIRFLHWQESKISGHCTVVVGALFVLKKM